MRLEVAADSDGDGIPDTVERANGLDPQDATDAAGNLDGDELSNLDEYLLGTNMNDPIHPIVRDTTGSYVHLVIFSRLE